MKFQKRRNIFLMGLLALVLFFAPITGDVAKATTGNVVDTTSYESVEDAKAFIDENKANLKEAETEIEEAKEYIREEIPMYSSFWALVPPIVAIVLALLTKEVYISLFVGILAGALFYANFNLERMMDAIFVQGIISNVSDTWNVGILCFLVMLGIMVSLINSAGGSAAYGEWASSKIKSKRGALLSTFALGAVIFVDDYFNCLTVGSVMRPVTDKFKISRAKLAYIIDSTAAPVCILAPISSWAAAVTGIVNGYDGFELFVNAIPYNFYAILTIVMIITTIVLKFDFGSMKVHELNAEHGDLHTTSVHPFSEEVDTSTKKNGKVIDLVLPVLILVASCIWGMIYTGGFFDGESLRDAFANCDASIALVYGSFIALVCTFFIYVPRKVLTFKEFADCLSDGFKSMVPAILILIFAWTLGGMTKLLGADVYVAGLVSGSAASLQMLLPAIIFVVAIFLAFATGTSWGTFGILLPIVVTVLTPGSTMLVIAISACLAGAVCGDHISPISDTTIMASTGAQCDHISHVSTQLPYALVVAGVSFVSYILAAFIQNWMIVLPIAIVLMILVVFVIRFFYNKKHQA